MNTQLSKLFELIEPIVVGEGYELADLEWTRDRGGWVLRIFIDKVDAKIGLDDCTTVSRQVSAALDVNEVIAQHYTLEVSSPGIDRPLRNAEQFRRFIGQRAKVGLRAGVNGRRNFTGTILGVSGDGDATSIEVEVDDGQKFELPLRDLEKANLKGV